jgi:hypothetical protein
LDAAWKASELKGDRAGQQRARHQHGAERRAGRHDEGACRAEHGRHREDQRQRGPLQVGVEGERGGAGRFRQQRCAHHQPTVAAVGHLARRQGEQEQRQELRQPDQAHQQGGLRHRAVLARELVHLPAQRHRLGLRAQDGAEPRAPEQGEIAVAEGVQRL